MRPIGTIGLTVILAWGAPLAAADTAQELLAKAAEALRAQRTEEALKLAGQAIAADPNSSAAYRLRAAANGQAGKHSAAVADYDAALRLDPAAAELYDARGSEQFILGRIDESLRDFDQFLKLRPDQQPWHWKRGISYYYAGKFREGAKQFEAYQTVDDNDVENVVWRYLCMAKAEGVEAARQGLLKVRRDERVPMMTIYELFAGRAQPQEVLAAADQGLKQRRSEQQFYAQLYLGLYWEAQGDAQRSKEHIAKAADDYRLEHYMWHVARVHKQLREKPAQK